MQPLFERLRTFSQPSDRDNARQALKSLSSLIGSALAKPLRVFATEVGGIDVLFRMLAIFDEESDILNLVCEILEKLFAAPDAASFLLDANVWPALSHGFNNAEPRVRVCSLMALKRCARADASDASPSRCPLLSKETDVLGFLTEGIRDLTSEVSCAAVNCCLAMALTSEGVAFLTRPEIAEALVRAAPIPALDVFAQIAATSPEQTRLVEQTCVPAELSRMALAAAEDVLAATNALELMKKFATSAAGCSVLEKSGCLSVVLAHLNEVSITTPVAMEVCSLALLNGDILPATRTNLLRAVLSVLCCADDPAAQATGIEVVCSAMLRSRGVAALNDCAPVPAACPLFVSPLAAGEEPKAAVPAPEESECAGSALRDCAIKACRVVGACFRPNADVGVICAVMAGLRDLATSGSPCVFPMYLSLGVANPNEPPKGDLRREERVIVGNPLDIIMSVVRCPEPLPRNLTNQALTALCKFEWFLGDVAANVPFVEWATDFRRMIDEQGHQSQRVLIDALLDSSFGHLLPLQVRTLIIKRKHRILEEKAPKVVVSDRSA